MEGRYLNKRKEQNIATVSMVLGIWFIEDESMILIESRVLKCIKVWKEQDNMGCVIWHDSDGDCARAGFKSFQSAEDLYKANEVYYVNDKGSSVAIR